MTRDKVIEEIENYENYPNGLSKECRDYIIKALEQEPVLDKIRAEIEKWHKEGTNWSDIRLMEIENIVNEVQGRK